MPNGHAPANCHTLIDFFILAGATHGNIFAERTLKGVSESELQKKTADMPNTPPPKCRSHESYMTPFELQSFITAVFINMRNRE